MCSMSAKYGCGPTPMLCVKKLVAMFLRRNPRNQTFKHATHDKRACWICEIKLNNYLSAKSATPPGGANHY